jgi:hypothetical protein
VHYLNISIEAEFPLKMQSFCAYLWCQVDL